jgi:hypothetical protein
MEVRVIFVSPSGKEHIQYVTERSSEERTIAAACRLLDRKWGLAEARRWMPLRVA